MCDSICSICLDPLSSPVGAMTPCGHCFHMVCMQRWADSAQSSYYQLPCQCPFCQQPAKSWMKLFLELPPPYSTHAYDSDNDNNDGEDEHTEHTEHNKDDNDDVAHRQNAASTTTTTTNVHNDDGIQNHATDDECDDSGIQTIATDPTDMNQSHNNDTLILPTTTTTTTTTMTTISPLEKENSQLRKQIRQLQRTIVSQCRKFLFKERQMVKDVVNLDTKVLSLQRSVDQCTVAMGGIQELRTEMLSQIRQVEEIKAELQAKLLEIMEQQQRQQQHEQQF